MTCSGRWPPCASIGMFEAMTRSGACATTRAVLLNLTQRECPPRTSLRRTVGRGQGARRDNGSVWLGVVSVTRSGALATALGRYNPRPVNEISLGRQLKVSPGWLSACKKHTSTGCATTSAPVLRCSARPCNCVRRLSSSKGAVSLKRAASFARRPCPSKCGPALVARPRPADAACSIRCRWCSLRAGGTSRGGRFSAVRRQTPGRCPSCGPGGRSIRGESRRSGYARRWAADWRRSGIGGPLGLPVSTTTFRVPKRG